MTEWEKAILDTMAIRTEFGSCPICKSERRMVKQELHAREGFDRTFWKCNKCGCEETCDMSVDIPK